MQAQAIRDKIRDYILKELVRDEDYLLEDDEGIISDGLMDSFALAEFAVYVEKEFDVYIPDPDLTVEKMDTLNQMVARVLLDMNLSDETEVSNDELAPEANAESSPPNQATDAPTSPTDQPPNTA